MEKTSFRSSKRSLEALSFHPGENLPIIRGSKILGISVRAGGGLTELRLENGNVNKSRGFPRHFVRAKYLLSNLYILISVSIEAGTASIQHGFSNLDEYIKVAGVCREGSRRMPVRSAATAAVALPPQHSRVNDATGERTILIIITITAAAAATDAIGLFSLGQKNLRRCSIIATQQCPSWHFRRCPLPIPRSPRRRRRAWRRWR